MSENGFATVKHLNKIKNILRLYTFKWEKTTAHQKKNLNQIKQNKTYTTENKRLWL